MPQSIKLKKPNVPSNRPFLSLCVMFRDNADQIRNLLNSVRGHFDEYVFTDTGSVDGTRKIIEAELPEAKLSNFEWCDDFGKARNFNWSQATGKWRMFLDADDTLVGGDKVRNFCKMVDLKHPEVEGFFVPYDYGMDERLDTMRLVRWREGWAWQDAIHERLEFSGKLLPSAMGKTEDFHVKHKYKTDKEKESAIRRNAIIAWREYQATIDEKYKARLARTIAMEMKMDGKALDSIPFLKELHNFYYLFPEGRQGAADIMKAHLALSMEEQKKQGGAQDHLDEALKWAKLAGPSYEAIAHHARKEYDLCMKAAQRGAGLGPQTTHEGLVFEQAAAILAMADAAHALGYSPNVVDHIINRPPPRLRTNPMLLPVLNALRQAINRITLVVPGTPQLFDEKGGGGMLGGSEEAVLYLAQALAREPFKRNVRIYTPLPPQRLPGADADGIDWQDIASFNPDHEHGTLVIWRMGGFAAQLLMLKQTGQKTLPGIGKCFMWLHDRSMGAGPNAPVVAQSVTGLMCLSGFHEQEIRRETENHGNFFRVANGVVEEDFPVPDESKRDPFKVVYSSCPSRGLVPLLEMWPRVKEAVPQAHLEIFYDWRMLELMQPDVYDRVKLAYEKVKHLDVTHHGGVDHARLHDELRTANVWAYSHFESTKVETFCISAVKAAACGATVLTVPNGALPETARDFGFFIENPKEYETALISELLHPEPVTARQRWRELALGRFGWKVVAKEFDRLWTVLPDVTKVGV